MTRRQGGTVQSLDGAAGAGAAGAAEDLVAGGRLTGWLGRCAVAVVSRRRRSAACSVPDSANRIVDQGRSSPRSRSLPFFDSSGSVHAERLKQQGRLFPLFIFEMLTSTRRLRVSGFFVALTQRTHSQRAIGVISFHRSWIFCGAAATAVARSLGAFGSGHCLVPSMSSVTVSPALMPAACCSASSTLIQWPRFPSGSSTVWNPAPLIVPR